MNQKELAQEAYDKWVTSVPRTKLPERDKELKDHRERKIIKAALRRIEQNNENYRRDHRFYR